MREPKDSDFFVELPGVGVFRYGRRTYGDELRIRAEQLRLMRGLESDPDIELYALMVAVHRVLCVEAPEGWEDLIDLDLTKVDIDKAVELILLLRKKEDFFREDAAQESEAARA